MHQAEPELTGIDISEKVIGSTKIRFAAYPKVRLLAARVEEMNFPAASFDLVSGINILQHITDEQEFLRAIHHIVRVTKRDGHILVMDFSPVKVDKRQPSPYVVYRSRQEYIDVFKDGGCQFISEFGLPRIGVRLYRGVSTVGEFVRLLALQSKHQGEVLATKEANPPWRPRMGDFMRNLILKLARPLDCFLAPFPARYTDMRILIFQVTSR
jgi:SAM-dependent methyltransferase